MEKISFEELLGLSCVVKEEEAKQEKVINLRTEDILPEYHAMLFQVFMRG